MSRLLKFEFYKLIKNKAFIICSAITLGLNIFTVVAIKVITVLTNETFFPISGAGYMLLTLGSSFTMIISVFTSLFVCSDYEQETIKNVYSRGFSRPNVFFAKYLAVICGALFMYVLSAIMNLILGSILFSGGNAVEDLAIKVILQVLLVWAYTSLAFMFGMVFKKMGAAIGLSVATPTVITLILTILTLVLQVAQNMDEAIISNISLNAYWLDGITSSVSVNILLGAEGLMSKPDYLLNVVLTVSYAVVFTGLAFWVNAKSDK